MHCAPVLFSTHCKLRFDSWDKHPTPGYIVHIVSLSCLCFPVKVSWAWFAIRVGLLGEKPRALVNCTPCQSLRTLSTNPLDAGGWVLASSGGVGHETKIWYPVPVKAGRKEMFFSIHQRFFWKQKAEEKRGAVFWVEFVLTTWFLLWTVICGCFIN